MDLNLNVSNILILFSGVAFVVYGLLCLLTDHMLKEFERYKLSKFRKITGGFELIGGVGSLIGLYYQPILIISSLGLAVLMLLGCIVRLRLKDSFLLITPAFVLMILNLFIFFRAFIAS